MSILQNDESCRDFINIEEAPYYNTDTRVKEQEQYRNAVYHALKTGVMFYGDTIIDNMDYIRRRIWGGEEDDNEILYKKPTPKPVQPATVPQSTEEPEKKKRKYLRRGKK